MSISNVNGALAAYQYAGKAQKISAKETVFAEKATETKEADSTQETSEAERLEAFKKEIWNEINRMPWNSSMNISIQITDGAFERMMHDSDFKDKMLNIIRKESIAAQPPGDTSLTWIDENGYKGYSYIDIEAGHAAFKSHSNDKDSFYVKKATKEVDYEKLWEEQRLQRKQQQERLDKEYVDKLYFDRNLLRKEQASAAYEADAVGEKAQASASVTEGSFSVTV